MLVVHDLAHLQAVGLQALHQVVLAALQAVHAVLGLEVTEVGQAAPQVLIGVGVLDPHQLALDQERQGVLQGPLVVGHLPLPEVGQGLHKVLAVEHRHQEATEAGQEVQLEAGVEVQVVHQVVRGVLQALQQVGHQALLDHQVHLKVESQVGRGHQEVVLVPQGVAPAPREVVLNPHVVGLAPRVVVPALHAVALAPHAAALAPHIVVPAPHAVALAPRVVVPALLTVALAPHAVALAPHIVVPVLLTVALAPHAVAPAPHIVVPALLTVALAPHTVALGPHAVALGPHAVALDPRVVVPALLTVAPLPNTAVLAPHAAALAPHAVALDPHAAGLDPHAAGLDPYAAVPALLAVVLALHQDLLRVLIADHDQGVVPILGVGLGRDQGQSLDPDLEAGLGQVVRGVVLAVLEKVLAVRRVVGQAPILKSALVSFALKMGNLLMSEIFCLVLRVPQPKQRFDNTYRRN